MLATTAGIRSTRPRRRNAAAVILAVALTVGACGAPADSTPAEAGSTAASATGTPDPSGAETPVPPNPATPNPSVTAPPSASPDPSRPAPPRPTPPRELRVDDAASAGIVFAYFLDLVDYAYRSGDTKDLAELSGPDCGFCARTIANATVILENGWWVDGGAMTWTADPVVTPVGDGTYHVIATVNHEEMRVRYSEESTSPGGVTAGEKNYTATLWFDNGTWHVLGVDVTERPAS